VATYSDAIAGAHRSLNDASAVRYTAAATFAYAQDAIREIATLRPDLFISVAIINCTAGVVDQSIGTAGVYLVDVVGVVNGRAVVKGDLPTLMRYRRNWRYDTAGECENWFPVVDDATKRPSASFIIYPKAPVGQQLITHVVVEPILGTPVVADEMPVPDQLLPAVESYIIFRCEMADDEHVNSGRAQAAYTNFATILGVDEKTRKTIVIEGRPQ
jgi:hypothetical protein